MTAKEIITKIEKAQKIEDILSIKTLKADFTDIIKAIHPDICKEPGAQEAVSKLNDWKDKYEKGIPIKDDVGTYFTNGYWAKFDSKEPSFDWSIANYKIFKSFKGNPHDHFIKYTPERAISDNGSFTFHFDKRSIPLSGLLLPQEHVNWILNRLLEYCAYLAEIGMVHAGLNPESVFIIPENHGIQIVSFYHLTKVGNKMKTISGKYASWYPPSVFTNKIATSDIDIECVKKIGAYLLGDRSGSGVKLRKTHNKDFIDFIVKHSSKPYDTLMEYRAMLKKNFKKEFHSLTI